MSIKSTLDELGEKLYKKPYVIVTTENSRDSST